MQAHQYDIAVVSHRRRESVSVNIIRVNTVAVGRRLHCARGLKKAKNSAEFAVKSSLLNYS